MAAQDLGPKIDALIRLTALQLTRDKTGAEGNRLAWPKWNRQRPDRSDRWDDTCYRARNAVSRTSQRLFAAEVNLLVDRRFVGMPAPKKIETGEEMVRLMVIYLRRTAGAKQKSSSSLTGLALVPLGSPTSIYYSERRQCDVEQSQAGRPKALVPTNRELKRYFSRSLGSLRSVFRNAWPKSSDCTGRCRQWTELVLAHQEGLDLTRYLDQGTVDRVRQLLPTSAVQTTGGQPRKNRPTPGSTRPVRIAPSLELVDAMLPASVAKDASRMATVYPKLYIFENSIRNVIVRVLRAKHGNNWWANCAPTSVGEVSGG